MTEEARVYFGVINFNVDPRSITEILGLSPHQTWRKDDPGPQRSRRTHDRWEFRGPKCEVASFEEQLDELLSILEGRRDRVLQVVNQFKAGIYCTAMYRETVNPGFHLSEDAIRRIAGLGLSCDFDLYILNGAEES
ncbi:MAG: DUF4279 domain-containing protein [Planctomycetota bacterium]